MAAASEELTAGAEQSALASQQVADSIVNVAEGAALQFSSVEETASSKQELNQNSHTVISTIDKISDLSKEVAKESKNVSAATQQQSASMEEMASSSQGLADIAQQLITAVGTFST